MILALNLQQISLKINDEDETLILQDMHISQDVACCVVVTLREEHDQDLH